MTVCLSYMVYCICDSYVCTYHTQSYIILTCTYIAGGVTMLKWCVMIINHLVNTTAADHLVTQRTGTSTAVELTCHFALEYSSLSIKRVEILSYLLSICAQKPFANWQLLPCMHMYVYLLYEAFVKFWIWIWIFNTHWRTWCPSIDLYSF